jgi:signal peptidase II
VRTAARSILVPLLLGAATVALDQATKEAVSRALPLGRSIPVLSGFVRLTHIQNPGGAFGIFRGAGPAFMFLSIAAVIVLFWTVRRYRTETFASQAALGLVLGGAIGNLIDRLRFGRVVDFLDVGYGDVRWPVFNVADVAVVAGVALFLLVTLRSGDARVGREIPENREESP